MIKRLLYFHTSSFSRKSVRYKKSRLWKRTTLLRFKECCMWYHKHLLPVYTIPQQYFEIHILTVTVLLQKNHMQYSIYCFFN